MHEFGVAQAIIKDLLKQIGDENVFTVVQLRFRRSSAFSEEVLRQTFSVLSAGTPLEGAELIVDISVLNVTCARCGQTSAVNSNDLVGHMFICPGCGVVCEITEAHDLELLEVIAQTEESLDILDV